MRIPPAALELEGVGKVFTTAGRSVVALEGVDLAIAAGEFVTVLGPSGCGKSTLLHIIGGFESSTSGTVRVHGRPVTSPGRDRGMVFQSPALFPWRTVLGNVAWPLQVAGMRRRAARERAAELLELVGLHDVPAAYPATLSGGMQQRAALARSLAQDPSVLLMDEPFGALDAQSRELLQGELRRIWRQAGLTVLFVTHDISEAVVLGGRVLVMGEAPGRVVTERRVPLSIQQCATALAGAEFTALCSELRHVLREGRDVAPHTAPGVPRKSA